MKKYGLTQNEYIDAMLNDGFEQLRNASDTIPGYFTYGTINNVPYIKYPGFSDEESMFAKSMAQEVLIISKRENNYKEVAIAYNLNNPEDYVVVKGSENAVLFYDDPDTAKLLNAAEHLMIVSLHNHADKSDMSLADISIFCLTPQIALMSVVNTEGEISFLKKNEDINLAPIFASAIIQEAPDIVLRKQIGEDIGKGYLDYLTPNESVRVKKRIIDNLEELGITYHSKINQNIDYSIDSTAHTDSISDNMERIWHEYMSLPKDQKSGIEWEGEKLRPAVFDDKYLAQCIIEKKTPDKEIREHFWKNCVNIQGYEPQFCSVNKDNNLIR